MTAGRSYPEKTDQTFSDVLDELRCPTASTGGRRCQLHRGHDGDCAAAWAEPRTGQVGTVGRPGPVHWTRWGSDGAEREQVPGAERLRWCCAHRD